MDGRIVTFAAIIGIVIVCCWLAFKPERGEMSCICIKDADGKIEQKIVGCPEHPEALGEAIRDNCTRVPGCTCAMCKTPQSAAIVPQMTIPGEDDPYWDIFLTKEELDKKYP